MRTPTLLSLPTTSLVYVLTVAAAAPSAFAVGQHPGEAVFRAACADCHGAAGQGDAVGYDQPLAGDMSIAELARRIEETMPEGDPEACVGQQARDVADYIYKEFYSYEARLKKGLVAPPRIELVRLTVPQYRNVVADLIEQAVPRAEPERPRRRRRRRQDTQPQVPVKAQPGLRGQYFQSEGMSKANELKLERVDPSVVLDFEDGSPAHGITSDQFAIVWQGSLLADDTGFYEFRIRTQNGARLYVNQEDTEGRARLRDDSEVAGEDPFIDAWVGSGELREVEGRVFLTGGRRYPLRLEFFKYLEPTASIALEWKSPHGVWAPLDARHVTTVGSRRSYAVDTPFPADDRSLGYERGNGISREWHEATTNAAIAAAEEVVRRMAQIADLNADDGGEAQLKDFVQRFASTAFRRPLSQAESESIRTIPFTDAPDLETAVRRAVLLIVQSPYFLYVDLVPPAQANSQHAVAARLALTLWDSIPDEALWQAAEAGQLASSEQIEAQARRMLDDPRARHKMRGFFHHWLELEERDLSKDKAMFPDFDEAVIADLRYSLEHFVEQVLWSEDSDYRKLLLADYLVLNDRLRKLYLPGGTEGSQLTGAARRRDESNHDSTVPRFRLVSQPQANEASGESAKPAAAEADAGSERFSNDQSGESESESDSDVIEEQQEEPTYKVVAEPPPLDEFRPVRFPQERRTGVLTHPYLLSAFAYHNNTSPIHRGVFLTRNIVGRGLKPPPIAVAFKNDEFPADLTMREKITQLTRDTACMSCHSVINPLGFALENFDPVGRWRTSDNDKPVDSLSQYTTDDGQTIQLAGARDIAQFAAGSESAHRAFVTQVFLHLVKQSPMAYEADAVDQLREQFVDDQFNMQNLMIRIAVLSATHGLSHETQN